MKVIFFDESILKWLNTLEVRTRAKADSLIDLLKDFGNNLTMPYSKKVGKNLFELRSTGQQKVRIFYTYYEGSAILLHGFIKKTQKIPQKELKLAKKYLQKLD